MRCINNVAQPPHGDPGEELLPGGPDGELMTSVKQLPQRGGRGAPGPKARRYPAESTDHVPPALRSGRRKGPPRRPTRER
eukprot:4931062-Lingulodinium_polyedra.AAC.1